LKIAYTYVAIDIFHYGHLKLLEIANSSADLHICGLLSDVVCLNWHGNLIMNYEERLAILNSLNCVDEVIEQSSIDPTDNLKTIHDHYPDAEIILFQGHQEWKKMPGTEYIKLIGGKAIKPKFYSRLTRRFIKSELSRVSSKSEFDIESYMIGNISLFTNNNTTKAKTLESLEPLLKKSLIEELFIFTTLQWKEYPTRIINDIENRFSNKIIVRSSSSAEDNLKTSNAGLFHSELNVDSQSAKAVKSAILRVIDSYKRNGDVNLEEQVLIQSQTKDVKISGVIFTRDIEGNSPYYVINYDIGDKTDSVTSGLVNNNIRIIRSIEPGQIPHPFSLLIKSVKEIEKLLQGLALDIEFAIKKNNKVVIFQVRPLAAINRFVDIDDENIYVLLKNTISQYGKLAQQSVHPSSYTLSDMSFWNPAEIIGGKADDLSYSLYHYLILSKAWNDGLISIGYKNVPRPLMVRLTNKPYIEVETAFKALLPQDITIQTEKILLNFFIDKLKNNPELHDKIEFDISFNCFSPRTDHQLNEVKELLSQSQYDEVRNSLISLTKNVFDDFHQIKYEDIDALKTLEEKRLEKSEIYNTSNLQEKISLVVKLLDDTRKLGTPQFSRMARLAFIGNEYLKGLVDIGVIDQGDADNYFSSIETVASNLNNDFTKVINKQLSIKEFNNIYGHLRPGTYGIKNIPYSKMPNYFNLKSGLDKIAFFDKEKKYDSKIFKDKIEQYLINFEISISADFLIMFIEETIIYRESFKFEFTKNLSLAIEWLAEIGKELGFSREDLSFLTVESLKGVSSTTPLLIIYELWESQIEGRKLKHNIANYVKLPPLIFKNNDLEFVDFRSAIPNFITSKKIMSESIDADSLAPSEYDSIFNKIVLLEKADPGFDWIFSKNISGLITKFGGVASHMAIRCAEFEIPAAIGCGDILYNSLKKAKVIDLDCKNKLLTSL
jgi:glutamine kinase